MQSSSLPASSSDGPKNTGQASSVQRSSSPAAPSSGRKNTGTASSVKQSSSPAASSCGPNASSVVKKKPHKRGKRNTFKKFEGLPDWARTIATEATTQTLPKQEATLRDANNLAVVLRNLIHEKRMVKDDIEKKNIKTAEKSASNNSSSSSSAQGHAGYMWRFSIAIALTCMIYASCDVAR